MTYKVHDFKEWLNATHHNNRSVFWRFFHTSDVRNEYDLKFFFILFISASERFVKIASSENG